MHRSLQYQESEITEEEFNPDIEKVEQARLEVLVKTRSLLRDEPQADYQQTEPDSDDQFISREDIQLLHHHLSAVSATPMSKEADHDYINQDVLDGSDMGHDYINQEMVDKAINETEGRSLLIDSNGCGLHISLICSHTLPALQCQ